MRTAQAIDSDIARIARQIEVREEIQRVQWFFVRDMQAGKLEECEGHLMRFAELLNEMGAK